MPIAAIPRALIRVPVLLLCALVVGALAACDASSGPATAQPIDVRQVTVVGAGEVQGTPDTLTINAAMEATAPDATGAMNETSERQRAVIDGLVGSGVDRADISTSQFSLQPQFGPDNDIIGYRASNTIDIKIRQLDNASTVLAQIADTGGNATRINSVSYSIEDDSQLVRDARARAFEDARDRADQYAELSGLTLGKVISISETTSSTPPMPVPMPRAAMEAVPLEPGEQTVGFSVTVMWELT